MPKVERDLSSHVVIVGGGPSGLWTGIQTRLLSGRNVTILEKNETYQRAHIHLRINASSLEGIPSHPELERLVKKWGNTIVPIKEMEEDLTSLAHRIGIKILKGQVADPKMLPDLFPNAQLFIGADGARSSVRTAVFHNEFRFYSNLQYMAQIQYIVKPKSQEQAYSKKLQVFSRSYKMQKFAEHFVIEKSDPQPDGSLRVTLQIFIDKKTHDQIADATFKNPYYFETSLSKLPNSLREALLRWWGAQQELENKVILPSGEKNKLTAIALNSYAAKEVVKVDEKGRIWALVGDAAAAFPFFRAINNGFMLGTKLAHCIDEGLKKDALETCLASYSRYTRFRVQIERVRAWIKSFWITCLSVLFQMINRFPFQVIKIKGAEQLRLRNCGIRIWDQLILRDNDQNGSTAWSVFPKVPKPTT